MKWHFCNLNYNFTCRTIRESTGTIAVPSVQIVDIRLIPWTTRWCFPLQCRVTISIWCEYGLSKVLSSITSTPLSCSIIRFASLYSAPVWWGCLSNNRLTESWAIGSDSFGKYRDASEHVHARYVVMRKLTKSLLVHFGGFTLVRSPFRVCIALY